jgi:hypothetical protein
MSDQQVPLEPGCQCENTEKYLSTGIINDVICGMKDHESPEILARFLFGKKLEKRSFLQNPSLVKSIGPSWSIGAGVFETGEIAQVEVLDESFGSWTRGVVDIVDVLHTLWKKKLGRSVLYM